MTKLAQTGVASIAVMLLTLGALLVPASVPAEAASAPCVFWVGKKGSDRAAGTKTSPWATVTHAVAAVPDDSCTIKVKPGTYRESIEIERRFSTRVAIRSTKRYRAIFKSDSTVLDVDGARAVTIAGFIFRHDGPGASGQVINVDNGGGIWAEDIKLRNNIIHDSYDDDLLKIHAGVKDAVVDGNVFYNQGPGEQHMDVNSVTDVRIQDNIFFNDFAGSGRGNVDSKHFIVVKDSDGFDDGLNGSERIKIRRNVFMNWEGDVQAFLRLGNDGEPYREAKGVRVNNNLFLGNSQNAASTPLGMSGVARVFFLNNTIVGDLPSGNYGFSITIKGANPKNRDVVLANNIWSDHSGTMDEFSGGDANSVTGLVLDSNLYWNGGSSLPDGDVLSPRDDSSRVVGNPRLQTNHRAVVLPIWKGSRFESGGLRIRDEFVRLAERYATVPDSSPAVDRADPKWAPPADILGRPRIGSPDIGAFETASGGADLVTGNGQGRHNVIR